MKKLTMALIALPILAIGTTTIAGMKYASDDDRCERGERYSQEDRQKRNPDKMVERLAKKLELSQTQKNEVKQLFITKQQQRETMREQMQSLHKTLRGLDPSAADYASALAQAKQKAALMAESKIDERMHMKAAMQKILSPEQMAQFEEMQSKRKHYQGMER